MFNWLYSATPGSSLRALRASGKLRVQLPEVDALYGVPQPPEHHPEVDTGRHIELCLDAAAALGASGPARFAVLLHDLGKAVTDKDNWPSHHSHERLGIPLVQQLCKRLCIDKYRTRLAVLVAGEHLLAHKALELNSNTVIEMLDSTGLMDDEQLLEDFIMACEADARGRLGLEDRAYPQAKFLRLANAAIRRLPDPAMVAPNGAEWSRRHKMRLAAVDKVRKQLVGDKPEAVASPD